MTNASFPALLLAAAILCGCASKRPNAAEPNVDAMIRAYDTETGGPARAAALRRLALTRDPRAAVALGEALDDPEPHVRVSATDGLIRHFMPAPVRGGTEQQMDAAHAFWNEHGGEYRQRAAALGPRQLRQIETGLDGRPSPAKRPERLVPVIVELHAPGAPYKADAPIMLTITVRNMSSSIIYFHGFGVTPTEWNAETASIDLTDIERTKKQFNLFVQRPRVVPPPRVQGESREAIPPGGELAITFDARKWTIVGDWGQGAYRVRACVRGLELDAYTRAAIATDDCVIEIDKPR